MIKTVKSLKLIQKRMKQQIERNRDCLAYMMANVEEEIKDMILEINKSKKPNMKELVQPLLQINMPLMRWL